MKIQQNKKSWTWKKTFANLINMLKHSKSSCLCTNTFILKCVSLDERNIEDSAENQTILIFTCTKQPVRIYVVNCFLVRNDFILPFFNLNRLLERVSVLPLAMVPLAFKLGVFFNSFFNFRFSVVALDLEGFLKTMNL